MATHVMGSNDSSEVESLLFRAQHLADDEIDSLKRSLSSMKVENLRSLLKFGSAANWHSAKERHN